MILRMLRDKGEESERKQREILYTVLFTVMTPPRYNAPDMTPPNYKT